MLRGDTLVLRPSRLRRRAVRIVDLCPRRARRGAGHEGVEGEVPMQMLAAPIHYGANTLFVELTLQRALHRRSRLRRCAAR